MNSVFLLLTSPHYFNSKVLDKTHITEIETWLNNFINMGLYVNNNFSAFFNCDDFTSNF